MLYNVKGKTSNKYQVRSKTWSKHRNLFFSNPETVFSTNTEFYHRYTHRGSQCSHCFTWDF